MSKSLPPPLSMKVQRGALVPATPYDAERLDSYRVGSTVHVLFTADRMRPLERKYRAILSKVIKDCKTPWSNAEAAHQALKLACGYVNVGKTASGQFMQWPRSLADLDDREMSDYFDDAMALLSRMTGVDVATLRKETAHVDEEPHDRETGDVLTDQSPNSGSTPSEPDTAEGETPIAPAASDDTPPASSSDAPPSERETLIKFARDMLPMAADTSVSPAALKAVEREYAPIIKALSPEGIDQARAISESVRTIANDPKRLGPALEHFAEVLETTVENLRGDGDGQ